MSRRTKDKRKNKTGKGRTPLHKMELIAATEYAHAAGKVDPPSEDRLRKWLTPVYAAQNSLQYGTMGLGEYGLLLEMAVTLAHLTRDLASDGTEAVHNGLRGRHAHAERAAESLCTVGERQGKTGKFVATAQELSDVKDMVADLAQVMEAAPEGYTIRALRKAYTEKNRVLLRMAREQGMATKGSGK